MIRVLIVDDELMMRLGLKSLIPWEEHGFAIIGEAANGKEAMEFLADNRADLIITDIKMPVMDGIELIRQSSNFPYPLEYLILSCLDEFRYVKEAMKLGAADYLIKSDIKPSHLLETLTGIKHKIRTKLEEKLEMNENLTQSIQYLKDSLFKDVISGLKGEADVTQKRNPLNIRIEPERLIVLKIKLDNFGEIKKKYVEKDEKLLRFTIVNMLEEVIPRKVRKEIVTEASDEYIMIMNAAANPSPSGHDPKLRQTVLKLCRTVSETVKDFLNIRLTIGVSRMFSGYGRIRAAYHEADAALKRRFFLGTGRTIFCDDPFEPHAHHVQMLDKHAERQLKLYMETLNQEGCAELIGELHERMLQLNMAESSIRNNYLRLVELIGSHLPGPHLPAFSPAETPYERILAMETMEDIRRYVIEYTDACMKAIRNEEWGDGKSYVEKAIELIDKHYDQELSLQFIAAHINVNPSYFSRIFKQKTGENFVSYLTKVRMERAKAYLESKRLKVYEVAEKVGYHNYPYFSKTFKKFVGVSPEEYLGKGADQ